MKIFGFDIQTDSADRAKELRDVIHFVMENPRLSLDVVERLIKMLIDNKISVEQLYAYSFAQDGMNKETEVALHQRIDAWIERFGPFTYDDFAYLKSESSTANYEYKPKDISGIVSYICNRIIGQDKAIQTLVSSVWLHCESVRKGLKIKIPAQLLIGSTGVGKSQILNILAELLHCPVIRVNASSTVAPGYRGGDSITDQIFGQLSDLKLEYPNISEVPIIIMVTEIDKVVRGKDDGYRVELMSSIMALIEKSKIVKPNPLNNTTQTLNLSNVLVLFDGCFDKIEDVVARRLNISKIGFGNGDTKYNKNEIRKMITASDIISYGMMPEFVGRIGSIICLNNMTHDVLRKILTDSADSPVKTYIDAFYKYGHNLKFTDGALSAIADIALDQKLGARVLESIICSLVQPYTHLLTCSKTQNITIDKSDVDQLYYRNTNYK